MASIWDLLPASLWPVQPIVWPTDPMQPSPWPQEAAPSQPLASAAPAFGWAPAPAGPTSTPTFGWAAAPPAPANAPAYSGATDPDAFYGSAPDAEIVDSARTAQLLRDAKRAHAFASWWFGSPSVRPAQQTRDPAIGPNDTPAQVSWPRRGATALSGDAPGAPASDLAAPIAATATAAEEPGLRPANSGDQWGAPTGGPDTVPVRALAGAAQPPGLDAASGNPNIQRQGERIRANAAKRNPPPAFVRTAADDFAHGLRETPLQILGGMRDAVQAAGDFVAWLEDQDIKEANKSLLPGDRPYAPDFRPPPLPEVPGATSHTGGTVRAVAQFLTGFAAGGPIGDAAELPMAGQMLARGAFSDFLFRGAHDPRLADLLDQVPALRSPVTDYLKRDPDDGEAEGRLKNAIEGLGLGALGIGLFRAVRALRPQRLLRKTEPPIEPSPPSPTTPLELKPASALDNANYAQNWYDEEFHPKGRFANRTIDELVDDLNSNKLAPSDIPIQYVVRDGHTLILNTRSSQALDRAGIPRSQWLPVNKTGDERAESALSDQLRRNGLTSEGTPKTMTREDWLKAGNPLWSRNRR